MSNGMFIWTMILIVAFVFTGLLVTADHVYTGTNIHFYNSRSIRFDADKVTVEAASSEPFLLQNARNEAIVGLPAQPPLGWEDSTYYHFGPKEVTGGVYKFPTGSASFIITSAEPIQVTTFEPHPVVVWLLFLFLAALLWMLGWALS